MIRKVYGFFGLRYYMRRKLIAFLKLSRLPFLTPGIAPFTAGILLGILKGYSVDIRLIILSYIGLILIMLATYYSNEYYDYETDRINKEYNRFSGGSRVLPEGKLSRDTAFKCFVMAIVGIFIVALIYFLFFFKDRPFLCVMAIIGLIAGIFYTTPPFQWAYMGIGEITILFAYGFLTVLSGHYIVTGKISWESLFLSLPPAFGVFSVILINEFPDYLADKTVGKNNLVVRFGKELSSYIYILTVLLTGFTALLAGFMISGLIGLVIAIPVVLISLILTSKVIKGEYRVPEKLERICALTIVLDAVCAYPPVLAMII